MRLDTDTTYHADFDSDAFLALTENPEAYANHLFNVRVLNLDGSLFGGWYLCILRLLGDRYVFIPLFDSMKESFLYDATPIETYLISTFTMHTETIGGIDPDSDFIRAYKLPSSAIDSFTRRAKRKDGNLVVTVLRDGVLSELTFMPSLVVDYR